jgi:protein-S-isoprenylcysteine O-methyltransferase Ste14
MRASALEFRFRVLIHTVLIILGFWAPWIEWLNLGRRISLLEWLALELSRLGLVSFAAATPIVIVLATLIAAFSVWLRVWGTAYLDPDIVHAASMKAGMNAGEVMASGPYRYVRNPLYLGVIFMVAAMAFAMPVSGAIFALILVPLFDLRLILGEEKFLTAKLGEPYQAYLRAVPRLIPRLRTTLPTSSLPAHWLRSVFAELTPIGVFLTTAILWWLYNATLLGRAYLVSFGISLIARALFPAVSVTPAE